MIARVWFLLLICSLVGCKSTETKQRSELVQMIERTARLPSGARSISAYDRYYAITRGGAEITGIYLFDRGWAHRFGWPNGTRWVSESELPVGGRDTGCGTVFVHYSPATHVARAFCDGPCRNVSACVAITTEPQRAPEFADFPAGVFSGPLQFPKEDKWPDPNWREDSTRPIDFAGRFTRINMNCGIACTSDWIVDRKNGQLIRTPDGERDVEPLSIETRADSSLMRITWVSSRNDGSGDTFPPCFRQDFVWTGSAFRALSKRAQAKCPPEVTQK